MKKSKLLIPALSIASVGAVVAPMVTSCTKDVVFLTTDSVDYVPESYLPTEEVTTTTRLNEIIKDYLAEGKHLAQDFAYYFQDQAKETKESLEEQKTAGDIKDYELKSVVTIKNVSVTEKTFNFPESTHYSLKGEVNGYLLNAVIVVNDYQKVTYNIDTSAQTQVVDAITKTRTYTLSNAFTTINPNDGTGASRLEMYHITEGTTYSSAIVHSERITQTLDSTTQQEINREVDVQNNNDEEKLTSTKEVSQIGGALARFPTSGLYYLAKVTFNI